MVYDIDAQRRSLSVLGHADDGELLLFRSVLSCPDRSFRSLVVNAVCFADESSTNILVSGSDDGYVKVWDRRSLSSSTPSGVLVGATEGITYTSPKGDGRYIVVNSKDQAARLYDLRKMRSYGEFEGEPDAVSRYGQPRYDCARRILCEMRGDADERRSEFEIPGTTAIGSSQGLLGHDLSWTLGAADVDPMSFQPERVDRSKLYLFGQRRWDDSYLVS